ncbi:phage Gp37/Gp68 family protein [Candidatus Poribacteria bacterium]|nr:phage Gp37/Gp68 family protein [Candidatus Poribacteria bacterium]MBT7098418.1 phage Gp37/Gp68 family protein [Candidatus Poribacteria bacterium]MBT7805401.1 phage Gp37/Gp68 family protein [Candidatus Poribacteria bacterium]
MGDKSDIEWTEATWNPVTGCTKISPGCKNCYAERVALRLQAMGQRNYAEGFDLALHEHALEIPLTWKRPRMIFVNSMSDLLHEDVPDEFILRMFDTMRAADWHTYQILTKRSERLLDLDPTLPWAPHIWMGVSVENDDYAWRVDQLRATTGHVKFLSLVPLLGPFPDIDLTGIDWVIVGGESGPGARPMDASWATDVRDRCVADGVHFYFMQWGGRHRKKAGREFEGRTWDEMPPVTPPPKSHPAPSPQLLLPGMAG